VIISNDWNYIPGVLVVAPSFQVYEASDIAKVIEEEVGIFSSYTSNYESLETLGRVFAKSCIPLGFWI
jgi:hypothetical protein